MKNISSYFLVLFASFFLVIQSFGQSDSIKINLNLSGEVLKKLDNKDIVEIIKFRDNLAHENEKAMGAKVHEQDQPTAISVSIWIFMSWFFFLILISIPFYFNHKRIQGHQLILRNLIEKGQEIPEELIAPSSKPGRSDFHKGLIMIALGIGIVIVLLSLNLGYNYWTIGLIPMLIGIAYLISFKYFNRVK
jgi:Flp pilus assembly protein TadB